MLTISTKLEGRFRYRMFKLFWKERPDLRNDNRFINAIVLSSEDRMLITEEMIPMILKWEKEFSRSRKIHHRCTYTVQHSSGGPSDTSGPFIQERQDND